MAANVDVSVRDNVHVNVYVIVGVIERVRRGDLKLARAKPHERYEIQGKPPSGRAGQAAPCAQRGNGVGKLEESTRSNRVVSL